MSFSEILGNMSPTLRGGKRLGDLIAAMAPPPNTAVTTTAADGTAITTVSPGTPAPSMSKLALSVAPGLAAAAIGAGVWGEHRVLGFLSGHALGAIAIPLYRGAGDERKKALTMAAVEGSGVAGALLWKKHPAMGWLAGVVVSSVATAFLKGSASREAFDKIRHAATEM